MNSAWPLVPCKQNEIFSHSGSESVAQHIRVRRWWWEISVQAPLADSPPSPPLQRLSVEILPGWCLRWARTKLVRLRTPAYLERGPPGSGWTACCCRSSWSRLGWSSGWPAGTSPAPGCWRSLTTRPELQKQTLVVVVFFNTRTSGRITDPGGSYNPDLL